MKKSPEERTLPHNLEAERSVLGVLLVHGDRLGEVQDDLAPTDFYREAHRLIYTEMLRMAERNVRIDLVTLKDAMTSANTLNEAGGPAYLASLMDGVPRSTNIEHYANVVREKATLRALIFAGNRIMQDAYAAGNTPAIEVAGAAEKAILDVVQGRGNGSADVVDGAALSGLARSVVEKLFDHRLPVTGVPTGLRELDAETRGMHPGQLIVLASRPGEGKTTLMLDIARQARVPTLVSSLEMTREELGVRLLSAEAQIDSHRLQTAALGQKDFGKVTHGLECIAATPLFVDDGANRSVAQIRSLARRYHARHGIGLLCVDYLGLIQTDRRRDKRHLELADVTRSLKLLAKELRIPVLLLCQLNRDSAKTMRRPQLSDLAESGATEQDADQVWFIWHSSHPDERGVAEIIVAKNRSGPKTIVKVAHLEEQYRFADLAQSHD